MMSNNGVAKPEVDAGECPAMKDIPHIRHVGEIMAILGASNPSLPYLDLDLASIQSEMYKVKSCSFVG